MINSFKRLLERLYSWPSLLLTMTCLFWAVNTIAGRLAVGQITPTTLTFLRWVLVLAVLWPVCGAQVRQHWPAIRPRFWRIVLMGALGYTVFNVLYYVAAHYTTAINLGILQGSMPVFVLATAFVAYGARVSMPQALGVLITTIGVVVIATQGEPLAMLRIEFNRGDLLLLLACLLYAFFTVALRDRPQMPGIAFLTLLAVIAAATSLPVVAFEALTTGLSVPTMQGLLVTLFVAIFPSFLAQIFLLRAVDLVGPGRAGVFMNLVPVFSAIMAVGLLGEPFAIYHAVALVLVIGGILLAQLASGEPGARTGGAVPAQRG